MYLMLIIQVYWVGGRIHHERISAALDIGFEGDQNFQKPKLNIFDRWYVSFIARTETNGNLQKQKMILLKHILMIAVTLQKSSSIFSYILLTMGALDYIIFTKKYIFH